MENEEMVLPPRAMTPPRRGTAMQASQEKLATHAVTCPPERIWRSPC